MEYIYVGNVTRSKIDKGSADLLFVSHDQDTGVLNDLIKYDNTPYCLVPADDILKTNDELLRLRDEVKQWEAECNEWKKRYAKVNNNLFQKGLAYGTLETAYKNEKIAGEMLIKDRDALREKVNKLEAELMEIKTTRTLREAYITGVEKGCESLREERDAWKRRFDRADKLIADLKKDNQGLEAQKKRLTDTAAYWKGRFTSIMTDFGKILEANGVTFSVKNIDNDGNWDVVIDIPELNEAKEKVEDLEKKLAASKSNENYWRDRKEEEEDCHHYWHYTFDRAVKQAAETGVHIGVHGTDEDCNAGVVVVDNMKAEELEGRIKRLEDDNSAKDRGDYWRLEHQKLEVKHNAKWSAMTEALKDKGVEVIYMGEEDEKPIIDVKVPGWEADKKWVTTFSKRVADLRADNLGLESERDDLKDQCDILRKDGVLKGQQCLKLKEDLNALKKEYGRVLSEFALCRKQAEYDRKELEDLKSKKVAACTVETGFDGAFKFIFTYMDGHNEPAHINCLCKNYIDAENISCGTIPKCKTCKNHRYFTNGGHLCHRPDHKYKIPGMFHVKSLTEEEAEGPACEKFEAKE